eukprot:16447651-Heterocapsa_arctica.AAC.1
MEKLFPGTLGKLMRGQVLLTGPRWLKKVSSRFHELRTTSRLEVFQRLGVYRFADREDDIQPEVFQEPAGDDPSSSDDGALFDHDNGVTTPLGSDEEHCPDNSCLLYTSPSPRDA